MLVDSFNRPIDYLRVSVTDRCDLRCNYCMPKAHNDYEDPEDWLSLAELTRVIGLFGDLGVHRVRLTGGEPLLRRGLEGLVRGIRAHGIADVSLTTNGTRLRQQARALAHAGLQRINISLDSLDGDCVAKIVGRDVLDTILNGIAAAQEAGLTPIKINMVVMDGINAHEVEAMMVFAIERGLILRLIELMPMGDTARGQQGVDLTAALRERLVDRFDLTPSASEFGGGPARYWETRDGRGRVGFITPMSQHFCATCNRVRLTVDGVLLLCLGQEHSVELRPLLRAGASDAEMTAAILAAIAQKPERHEFVTAPQKLVRVMARTGG
jgi:cyclic pyranopterin phosphate synthase